MAQVSYGTITITDTNDINRIYVEYCRSTSNQLSGTTVPDITVNWSESTPAWVDGQYIWQRTVVEKSGTLTKTYGTPVCLTGAQGETGDQGPQGPQGGTGAAGRSLTSTTTQYTTAATSATITQSNMGSYTWSGNVPAYNANTPAYWVRITNVYSNPSSTEYIIYKDNGITDAVKTSHDANTTAAAANTTANNANTLANTANNTANNANSKADQAVTDVNNLQAELKYYWRNQTAHTQGNNGWTKPDYPVGTYAASGNNQTFDKQDSSTYGYNTWYANGINLRYNAIKLGELTGSALTFYQPSTTTQGAKAMELSGTALKFYASNGTTVQAEFGGDLAKVSGQLIAQSGYIGTNESNRWFIGNRLNYDQTSSAALVSYGTAYIQLGEDGCWRLSTNRLHTGWNAASGSNVLHYPKWNNIYWDFGIHVPSQNANKFIYIRNYDSTNSGLTEAQILQDLQNNFESNVSVLDSWQYRFYVTADGNLYARNLYVLDDNGQATQIGGTDGVYLLKSGGTITGDLTVNGTITGTLSGTATRVSKDLKIQLNGGTTENTNQFTYNGSTAKTVNITKSSVGLSNVENTALSTWAGSANLTTTKVGTLAAAAIKGVDTSITSTSTSTNLPTSAAVATLVRGYLPLTGGNVTGAVTFGSSVSADELTAGDLVVNGNASFTNNAQFNTINGVAVGNSPKFTDANVTQTATTTSAAYEVLFSYTADNTTRTEGARKTSTLTYNPSTKELTVGTVKIKEASTGFTISGGTTSKTLTVSGDYTLAAAAAKGVVTTIDTSANLPTSNAVKTFVEGKNYVTSSGVTTVTAGDGLSGGGTAATVTLKTNLRSFTKLTNDSAAATETSGRIYPVVLDKSGYLAVNVPWTNVNSSYLTSSSTLNWNNVTSNRPTTLGGYGITDAKIANGVVTLGSNTISKMPNPNALTIKVYNANTATAQGSTYSPTEVSYDGSASGKTASVAGTNAITNISASAASGGSSTFTVVKADGSSSTFNVNISGAVVSGATILTNSSGVGLDVDGPVYFDDGTPKSMKPNTSTGLFLKDDGTWATPSAAGSATNATNDSDGNAINTTYVKVNGSNKMTGNLIIRKAGTGANDWASRESNPSLIFEATDGQTAGFVYTQYDSVQSPDSVTLVGSQTGTYFIAPNIKATGSFYGNLSGTATTANRLAQNTEMTYAWNGINYFNISAANQSAAKVNDTPHASAVWTHILRFNHANSTGYYTDLAVPFNENGIFYKRICGGSLQNSTTNGGWVRVVDVLGTTMVGALNFANNTYNKVGDDAQFGDINQAGKIGIKGINGTTGIQFVPYSGSTSQTISIDGAGTMNITSNVSVANNLSSVWYNSYRWYADQNPNWWYRYSTTFTTSTVPTANWYVRVQLNCTWDPHLKPCVCMANYSNRAGVLYYEIDSHLSQDKWRAYLTSYGTNFISTKRVMESVTVNGSSVNKMVLYFEMAKPTEYNGSTPNGTFTIYSPVPIDSVTSVSAQTDMTTLGFGENLHGANITITSGSLIGRATLDGSGNTITSTYLNKAGDTMTGTLALRPASGEGGQIELRASAANTTQAGIILDQYGSTFRIFGIPSADGSTKTGTGTPLVIDPYGKTITGGYTITGTLSGNASTATTAATLQTSRTIFGKSFNGSANVEGQALVYGSYNATAASRYSTGGIQIREQGLVGSAQSDIAYAPTIGFHWGGRIAATLLFHSDGNFYLRKQDGVTRATLDANLNGNAATATKATQDGSGNTITTKYVTIDTNQTITASQKTFNGATRWSVSGSATGSKYGACQYDSTLDALVFSFGTI